MTRRSGCALCVLLVLFAFSCGTQSDTPLGVDASGLALAASGPSAGGHVDIDEDFPAFGISSEKYSFNAKIQNKGGVQGQFQVVDFVIDGKNTTIHGDVTCLVVEPDGKTARLTGLVTGSNDPTWVGTWAIWTVRDNGEGKKAPPDEASDLRYGVSQATADFHCATGFAPGGFPGFDVFQTSDAGNVQVRP